MFNLLASASNVVSTVYPKQKVTLTVYTGSFNPDTGLNEETSTSVETWAIIQPDEEIMKQQTDVSVDSQSYFNVYLTDLSVSIVNILLSKSNRNSTITADNFIYKIYSIRKWYGNGWVKAQGVLNKIVEVEEDIEDSNENT